MKTEVSAGDRVKLLSVPDWLAEDLSTSWKSARALVNDTRGKIDEYGHVWIGFGITTGNNDGMQSYCHSFCVRGDCVQLLTD